MTAAEPQRKTEPPAAEEPAATGGADLRLHIPTLLLLATSVLLSAQISGVDDDRSLRFEGVSAALMALSATSRLLPARTTNLGRPVLPGLCALSASVQGSWPSRPLRPSFLLNAQISGVPGRAGTSA